LEINANATCDRATRATLNVASAQESFRQALPLEAAAERRQRDRG
jgi:hypothetical protein